MKTPSFDSENFDRTTFAPIVLYNGLDRDEEDVQLNFADWAWLHGQYGETVNDYFLNGYGIEGLAMAARLNAGLDPEPDTIDYDAEGDACYIYFDNLEDAIETAQLLYDTRSDRTKVVGMIAIAQENEFGD